MNAKIGLNSDQCEHQNSKSKGKGNIPGATSIPFLFLTYLAQCQD